MYSRKGALTAPLFLKKKRPLKGISYSCFEKHLLLRENIEKFDQINNHTIFELPQSFWNIGTNIPHNT